MKVAWIIACLVVAGDCYKRGSGELAQTLFSADAGWLWYVICAYWVWVALKTLLMEIYS